MSLLQCVNSSFCLRSLQIIVLILASTACGSKAGEEEGAVLVNPSPAEESVKDIQVPEPIASTPAPEAVVLPPAPPPLISPIANNGTALLQNLPSDPSSHTQLNVSLAGSTLIKYQYALIADSTSCNGVSYSALRDPSTPITDALGLDGRKTLCVVAISKSGDETPKASALSYSWQKDATAPSLSLTSPTGFGPHMQAGAEFEIILSALDASSSLDAAQFSLSDGQSCLNSGLSAFDAPCPHLLPAALATNSSYRVMIPDSVLGDAQSYTLSAWVSDKAGNTQAQPQTLSFTWDTALPAAVASIAATVSEQDISLTWSAVSDAATYILIRREELAVGATPAAGYLPEVGVHLGTDNFVACKTSSTSCVDQNLKPYRRYHYQVIAFDAAKNRSQSGPRTQIQTLAKPAFQGINRVYLVGPERTIAAEWQMFTPPGAVANDMTYALFANESADTENFVTAVASSFNVDSLVYPDLSASDSLYFAARQWQADQLQDANTRELRLKLGAGVHHKIAASGRFLGQDPLGQTYLRSAWATAFDPFGNLVFGGAPGTINVICKETTQAYYCKGRSLDKIYTFAGTDGTDDGPDGALASASPMGEAYGIAFDGAGNMFVADASNFRVRVDCYAPAAAGACNGKTLGYSFHIAGTGSSVDGLDDSVAKTTGIGLPNGIGVDSQGNVYVSDSTFRRVRLICFQTAQSPCAGKIEGNIYNLVGTGVAGDAADNLPGLAANLGNLGTLSLDSLGNVFFSDSSYFRIRAYCRVVTGTEHFCAAKTAGNLYRVSGTGVTGDGLNDISADTSAIAVVNGMATSASGNLYFSTNSVAGNRLRVICFNASADYYCNGRTVGHSYRISGTGASTDGANNALAVAVSIGSPRGLALDAAGNMVFADPSNRRIRLHCVAPEVGGVCDGKLSDYHYHLAGAGVSSLGWNLDAFLTPMGLPQGLAEDSYGNLYLADATNFVARVICYDVANEGFCKNKVHGVSYIIAGNGLSGNAADNVLAIANPIGTITGVEVDAYGNLYLADNTNRTVRLVCGTNLGPCTSRAVGNIYRYIGTTTAADTADNAIAASSGLGQLADLAFDSVGNLWIADAQYFRVRLFCGTTLGSCASRTIGNIYRVAGTGATGNGADNAIATAAALGALTSIDVDPFGNIVLGDASNFYVRILCNNGNAGYCATKANPTGRIYRAIGTGVTGDALNDTLAAASAISAMNAVQADASGNIYVAETTNRRIRVLCLDASSGYCSGLNPGYTYRALGSALAGDASSGTAGSVARIDTPSRDSLLFTAEGGHLVYVGGGTPATLGTLRMFLSHE